MLVRVTLYFLGVAQRDELSGPWGVFSWLTGLTCFRVQFFLSAASVNGLKLVASMGEGNDVQLGAQIWNF